MIDVKTLRIGSHVCVGGKHVRICGITKRKVGYHATSKPCEHLQYARLNEIEPIPITGELLEKLGFEYRDNTYWEHWFLGSFDIEREDVSSCFNFSGDIRLEFLHEMESIYYMIYKRELIK